MHSGNTPVANARVSVTALTTTPQAIFAASGVTGDTGHVMMLGFIVGGGAAAEIVIFQSEDGLTEYFRVNVAANGYQDHGQPMCIAASKGMEVVTASAAGDVTVTVFHWVPGAYGIGV